ncbi:MAG TPA: DUF2069 domain-containing protein [Pseudomonadales bacterium]|nr:DUF2069 domain-containing protein [Pseudomonadales bacterium]
MTNTVKSYRAWQLTLTLYAALLIALVIDHALVRAQLFLPVLLIQTVPLLLILPGLLKQNARSGIWLCFMILFHFLLAIDHAFEKAHTVFYTGMAVLVLALFTTALLFVRWKTRS